MRIISCLLVFMVGCAAPLTYDEMSDQASSDPKIAKRLEKFERDAERAGDYLMAWNICKATPGCRIYCTHREGISERYADDRFIKGIDSLEEQVRWYRVMRTACGFSMQQGSVL